MIQFLFSKITSILFPSQCYGCQKQGQTICHTCLNNCKKTIETPYIYITSIYSFRDPLIKKVIHAIKYFHRKDLINPLTTELATILKSKLKEQKSNDEDSLRESSPPITYNPPPTTWVFVPIPMPKIRKYMRGYNQAELIAQELSKQCQIPVNNKLLIRKYSPKRQVKTKTRSERLQNQHNSFEVVGNVKDMNIILVDDVTTTGATLCESRKVLLKYGANEVIAVTIAH